MLFRAKRGGMMWEWPIALRPTTPSTVGCMAGGDIENILSSPVACCRTKLAFRRLLGYGGALSPDKRAKDHLEVDVSSCSVLISSALFSTPTWPCRCSPTTRNSTPRLLVHGSLVRHGRPHDPGDNPAPRRGRSSPNSSGRRRSVRYHRW